jgi:hypothetical protein
MSKKDNSINYIELPMDNNDEKKSTSRYLNNNLQLGDQVTSAFPVQKLMEVLVFLYVNDLNQQLESVTKAGRAISKPVFEFHREEDSIFVTQTRMNLQYGQSKFSRR